MILILSGIMCSVVMLKLRGFKASFNLLSGNKHGGDKREKSADVPVLGAYRRNKDEYYVANNVSNNSPRRLTPTVNSNQPKQRIKPAKSTSNLLSVDNIQHDTRNSTSDLSSSRQRKHSREHSEPRQSEPQKPEQRKREKPPRKPANIKLTRETNEQQHQEKPRREKKKGRAPKPPTIPPQQLQYSSNTLESSISRSSGPPPYSAEAIPNDKDNTGNTSFSKPVDESSWDLVSQHREQLNRPQTKSSAKPKSRVLDLNYNAGAQDSLEVKNNSEV